MSSESAASRLQPIHAGDLKLGHLVQHKGSPCRITRLDTVKTGKHGPAKVVTTLKNVVTGKKSAASFKSTNLVHRPVVDKHECLVIGVGGDGYLHMLDDANEPVDDVKLPPVGALRDGIVEALDRADDGADESVFVSFLVAPVGDDVAKVATDYRVDRGAAGG